MQLPEMFFCSPRDNTHPHLRPFLPPEPESPFFPIELEKKIFELAVRQSPQCATSLMLVAARVHNWIASIRYSVAHHLAGQVYPGRKIYMPTHYVHEYMPDIKYYGPFVKHLLVGGDLTVNDINKMLLSCPNVIEFGLWSPHPAREFLLCFRELKLERLSANLSSLNLADPAFSQLTHLDVTDLGTTWQQWQALTYIPRLSHVAINKSVDTDILIRLLRHCPKLEILMIVKNSDCWEKHEALITDPRFVMMHITRYVVSDWANGAAGKGDMWDGAEAISSAKQRGLFKDESKLATWFHDCYWKTELRKICSSSNDEL
ncbi:hypothetical protein HYPSUDRAFT_218282 [Hypholoma sublateritium FD-334 SS-4]|uniref:F-box domain-containing protein n=1 Tax=Hypholoma sublateritium (strain FD-334 SS-4) TaxID=945553 RepID=A0A0D2KUL2_HYPSF|nr:hypothetical protein HYPSUDRAFT_218282 [Hypholoma sublateritium FD-334 SS-4]